MQETPEELLQGLFSESARFQRWLDVEASLARAQACLGIIPSQVAAEISAKADVNLLDLQRYRTVFKETQHPIVSLLRLFQPVVGGDAGQYVHLGTTTQDVLDTGTMVALKRAHQIIYESLRRIELDLLNMAEAHADTIMAARTHNIQALPITFGFKVAGWAREIRRDIERFKACRDRLFVAQMQGAVGTMAAFGPQGPQVLVLVAQDLGLNIPDICWHSSRDRYAEFANLLGLVGTALDRLAREVYLLMGTEVGEVREPWRMGVIGSSTMPHKVNPERAQEMMSLARKLRYNVALVNEVVVVDHERNLEHFLAEMEKLEESCVIMGKLLTHAEDMARDLTIYPQRMRQNLDILHGLMLAESVMIELGKKIGKQTAHELVYEDAMKTIERGISFKRVLLDDPRVNRHLTESELDRLLDPRNYVALAPQITRDMVALSRKERELD